MKKFQIIETHTMTFDMLQKNIKLGTQGVVVEPGEDYGWVLFLDENNVGDYAYAKINDTDATTISKRPSDTFIKLVGYMLNNFNITEKGFKS